MDLEALFSNLQLDLHCPDCNHEIPVAFLSFFGSETIVICPNCNSSIEL